MSIKLDIDIMKSYHKAFMDSNLFVMGDTDFEYGNFVVIANELNISIIFLEQEKEYHIQATIDRFVVSVSVIAFDYSFVRAVKEIADNMNSWHMDIAGADKTDKTNISDISNSDIDFVLLNSEVEQYCKTKEISTGDFIENGSVGNRTMLGLWKKHFEQPKNQLGFVCKCINKPLDMFIINESKVK